MTCKDNLPLTGNPDTVANLPFYIHAGMELPPNPCKGIATVSKFGGDLSFTWLSQGQHVHHLFQSLYLVLIKGSELVDVDDVEIGTHPAHIVNLQFFQPSLLEEHIEPVYSGIDGGK